MARNARKRAERIYTQRAKQGFPPVSNVILHNDGTITDRVQARPYRTISRYDLSQPPTPSFVSSDFQKTKTPSLWMRFRSWIRRLIL